MKLAMWEIELTEVDGFMLFAPQSFISASQEDIDEKTGGCGPGKLGDALVPDRLLGESIHLACRIHDWMYGEGKTKEDKFWADLIFLVNMVILINDGEFLDSLRLRLVMDYYKAVSFAGGSSFD